MVLSLVSSGAVAWLALAVLGLEFLIVLALRRQRKMLLSFAANALSGALLILAFHAALTGGSVATMASLLGLGFVAHLADTIIRLRD